MIQKLEFKELNIGDRLEFDEWFNIEQPEISEYTFTNLFVWRKSRSVRFTKTDNGVFLLCEKNGEKYFTPPIGSGNIQQAYQTLIDYARDENFTPIFKKIPEEHKNVLQIPDLKIEDDRDNHDYVYLTTSLAHLKGNKYDGKRGFVNKFFSEHHFTCKGYDSGLKNMCLELARHWMDSRGADNPGLIEEFQAIQEMLDHIDELDIHGCVAMVDNKVIAFSFGEKLNNETFVIHFEKADVQYAGIYQAINQRFVENRVLGKYEYINREQDLGIAGIRKAKKSYHPSKMVKKYKAVFEG